MKIIYRTSDAGYNKVKPEYINNENCLKNFVRVFSKYLNDIIVITDNPSDELLNSIKNYIPIHNIIGVKVGHGAGTFNIALDMALQFDDNEIVYFVENDYLHRDGSDVVLLEGIAMGSHFVSLYDHPDKYVDGVNPLVTNGGEVTKVFLTDSCHWKFTNSTTMTFASKVNTLKRYESTLRKWSSKNHPHDFEMWMDFRSLDVSLITPLPGYSTHGETAWLSPITNWELYANNNS
jgi:hypothetical protein